MSGSALQFWVMVSLWGFLLTFTTPYVFGLAAAADVSGRVAVATGTAYIIVFEAGISIAAHIVAHHGLTLFDTVPLALSALAALLSAIVSRMCSASVRTPPAVRSGKIS
jgi:hypothetical protein